MEKYIYLIILTASLICNLSAQTDSKIFITLPMSEGAALSQTNDMLQDSKGFIWFGTTYGLTRYDGHKFKVYQTKQADSNSISFNDIISLHQDKDGDLWIGTRGGGLNFLSKNSEKFIRYIYTPDNYLGISDNIIKAITNDPKGNIWISTGSGMLNKLNKINNKVKRIVIFSDSTFKREKINVSTIFYENQYSLWIGHNLGITRYAPDENKVEHYNLRQDTESRNSISVLSIYKDKLNTLWVGTNSGLFRFNKTENKFYRIELTKNLMINSILEGTEDKLWCGTNHGIMLFDPETYKQEFIISDGKQYSIPGNIIKTIIKDRSGVFWVNCYNSGIAKYHPDYTRFTYYNFSQNLLKGITSDHEDNSYAAVENEGIYKLKYGIQNVDKISIENNLLQFISSINFYEGKLFVTTPELLLAFDLKSGKTVKDFFPQKLVAAIKRKQVNNLLFTRNNSFWIGTIENGIIIYNNENDTLINLYPSAAGNNKSSDYILKLYQDNKDRIWVGTYGGLFCYDQTGKLIKYFDFDSNSESSLSNNYVYEIYQDTKKEIWIGTASGLNKLKSIETGFRHFFIKDGLPNDIINGIIEDDSGNLWLSTNKGISRLNRDRNEFLNFFESDILQNDIFLPGICTRTNDGKIFFANLRGLTSLDPNNFPIDQYPCKPEIISIEVINQYGKIAFVEPGNQEIKFGHSSNSFRFQFAAFDYKNPENIKYKYKIDGYTNDWIYLNNKNSLTVSNLPSGDYKLTIKSANSDGIWSPLTSEFSFTVESSFWATWWFWLIVLFSLLIMVLTTYRLTLFLKVSKEFETDRIRKEENDKVRIHTAADFHDDLGHRITRISLLTEIIRRKLSFTFSEISPLLDQISENAAKLYDGTKDFIWAIDPKKDTLYELMIRLKDFGDELFNDTGIKFWANEPDENLLTTKIDMEWKRQLMLIFKEGINNSVKHSNCSLVILDTKLNRDEFEIILEDNGRGFNTDELKPGSVIKIMKHKAELLHLRMDLTSEPGRGTRISVKGKFPVKSLSFN